jgi:radical SAM-linked protein
MVARTAGRVPAPFGPGWRRDRTPTTASRLKLELRFSVRGRARFLSHLECVDVLLSAARRAGYEVALSNGMRPKPVISLAMARAVGVEAYDEIATIDIVGSPDPATLATRLTEALPRGIAVHDAAPSAGTPRLVGCCYQVVVDAPPDQVEAAAAAYHAAAGIVVERRSPKGRRELDAKRYAPLVEVVDGAITAEVALTDEGSLRPEELVRALEKASETELAVRTISRLTLRVAPPVGAPTTASGEPL